MLTTAVRRRRRRATVLLEFMLILPLFLFMTVFAVDMGRMILISGALNDAAYVSARAGAQRGDAGNVENGPARNAFDRAAQMIPGANMTENAEFRIVQGRCTDANSYVVIEVVQQVDFITPGLGRLLGLMARDPGAVPDTSTGWALRSRGAVLCEVVRP